MYNRRAKNLLLPKTFAMLKCIIFLLVVILCSVDVFGALDILSQYLNYLDTNITRVRTPAEREKRWSEYVVLDFIGLVEQYDGYVAEEYDVQTIDGYILKLHRVNGSPVNPQAFGKPVILVGPGLVTSSDFYVLFGPERSLIFDLADAGYDVWIGNFRGSTYSKRHMKYSTDSNSYEFWNFGLDELGLIDLPLFIDTVLEKTNKDKLTYIGYSMGTTTCFILLSSKPEYNDVINVAISLAPEVFFTPPFRPILNIFIKLIPPITNFFFNRKIYQIVPQSKFNQMIGRNICTTRAGRSACQLLFNTITSVNKIDSDTFSMIFEHFPAGASFFILIHYYQMMLSGKFRPYDYGLITNLENYGNIAPPQYDLTKVSCPQAIFYSENDIFSAERDVKTLKSKLQNVVLFEKAPKDFNHLDYLWHHDAKDVIFSRLLDIIGQYS